MAFDFKDINQQSSGSEQGNKNIDPLIHQVNSLDPGQQKNIQLVADSTQPGGKSPGESPLTRWRRVAAVKPDNSEPQHNSFEMLGNWFEGGLASLGTSALGGVVIRKYGLNRGGYNPATRERDLSTGLDTLHLYREDLAKWPPMMDNRRGEHATLDKNGVPMAGQPIRIESLFDSTDPVTGEKFPQLTPLEFARALPSLNHTLFERYNDPHWGLNAHGAPLPDLNAQFTGLYGNYTHDYRDYYALNHGGVQPPARPLMDHLAEISAEWRNQKQIVDATRGGPEQERAAENVRTLDLELQHAYPWLKYRAQYSPADAHYPNFVPYKTPEQHHRLTMTDLHTSRSYWSFACLDDLFGRYGHYANSSSSAGYQTWLGVKRFTLGAASALTPAILSNMDPISHIVTTSGAIGSWLTYSKLKNGPEAATSGESIRHQISTRGWRIGALLGIGAAIAATGGEQVHRLMSGTKSLIPTLLYEPTETQSIAIGIGMGFPVRRNFVWRVPMIGAWYLAGLGISKAGLKEPLRSLLPERMRDLIEPNKNPSGSSESPDQPRQP